MKRLTVILDPGDHKLVPVFDTLDKDVVKREHLYHYNMLTDGTVVLLYQLRGNLDHARTVFDASPDVLHYDIPDQEDGHVYLHCEMNESLTSILSTLQKSEVIMTIPIEFLSDDRVRVTFIGEHAPLHHILDRIAEVIDIEIEKVGEYSSEGRLSSKLTSRQREILTTAVEIGYYEVPRCATLSDIADEMELSVATAGEHLQKIEARILSEIVR